MYVYFSNMKYRFKELTNSENSSILLTDTFPMQLFSTP